MHSIAILGAGDLAATLARRVAEQEIARRIVLVDPDESRARGKALDIAQSAPVEGFDVHLEGVGSLAAAGVFDALVVADPAELEDPRLPPGRASALGESLVAAAGKGLLVVAAAAATTLIEAAVRKGMSRERVVGSAPVAYMSALRRRLATEMQAEPRAVSALLLGLPPDHLVAPHGGACLGGIPIDQLSPVALRRAAAGLAGRTLGPVALAAAAARVLRALQGSRASVLSVFAHLQGEYGHRGVTLAVPARLAAGRVESVIELPLDPVDRVAFDGAAQRRQQEAYWA